MKALIIGRFQPVHNGHIELIRVVDNLGLEKIILGIGDAEQGRTPRNPFYYDEVREIWLPNLEKLVTPVDIYRIPDINDNEHYAGHVEQITGCNEKDTIVVSGNGYTLDCFTDYGKSYRTCSTGKKILVNDKEYLNATMIREWIANDGPWKNYVPESTKKVIEKVDGIRIIKELGGQYAR